MVHGVKTRRRLIVHRVYLGAITMKASAKRRKEMAAMDAWEREFDAD
jgi:hypothetical protein